MADLHQEINPHDQWLLLRFMKYESKKKKHSNPLPSGHRYFFCSITQNTCLTHFIADILLLQRFITLSRCKLPCVGIYVPQCSTNIVVPTLDFIQSLESLNRCLFTAFRFTANHIKIIVITTNHYLDQASNASRFSPIFISIHFVFYYFLYILLLFAHFIVRLQNFTLFDDSDGLSGRQSVISKF